MASSVTTKIPTNDVNRWCWKQLYAGFPQAPTIQDVAHCANSTIGEKDSDFLNICCDGDIIDKTQKIFDPSRKGQFYINMENLVCCRDNTPQLGGIMPINTNQQICTAGNPTPLASLAATNTANAQIYPVTFISASGEAPHLGNFTFTQTPRCMWFYTAASNVTLSEITVAPAEITTLPVGWPDSNSPLIYPSPTVTYTQTAFSTDTSGWIHYSVYAIGQNSGTGRSTPTVTTAPATTTAVSRFGPGSVGAASVSQSAASTTSQSSARPKARVSWSLLFSQALLAASIFLQH